MSNKYPILLGIVTSLLAALFTALFGIFIVLDNKLIYFLVCLLLSFSVVVMVVSMRAFIAPERKVFINCAVAFAIMYAVLVGMVYYTQFVVLKGTLTPDQLTIVSDAPGTVFFFIDMLGYVFLCLATLFMAFSIDWSHKAFRVLLGIHSVIAIPTFLLPFLPISFSSSEASGQVSGPLILVAWCIIFIPVCLLATNYFRKQRTTKPESESG